MTIYVTPFKNSTKQCSGPSTDSGFDSIDAVVEALGDNFVYRGKAQVIYGDGEDRVIFSKIIFRIDEVGTTG